jgi:hypothetical protein
VTVSTDHASVKADIGNGEGGYKLKLSGNEILFSNAVFIVEYFKDVELNKLTA